jgi:hypothetical protein
MAGIPSSFMGLPWFRGLRHRNPDPQLGGTDHGADGFLGDRARGWKAGGHTLHINRPRGDLLLLGLWPGVVSAGSDRRLRLA